MDMYLHRAGRCARAGRSGTSYVIACDANINDRAFFNLVRRQINVDIVDATTFLRESNKCGMTSQLFFLQDRGLNKFGIQPYYSSVEANKNSVSFHHSYVHTFII